MSPTAQFPKIAAAAITLLLSGLLAEFLGYWLHRLLHSDKIAFLSRGHLIHHFLVYGPGQPMRHEHYHDSTDGRLSVGNVGLEWLLPSGLLLAVVWTILFVLHVPAVYQAIALATLVGWPVFMFSYLHDRMHQTDFWMVRDPLLRNWFLAARRLHDIHHHSIDLRGHMDANFGIGFFWFDRVFRTLSSRHRPFNLHGFETARRRYGLTKQDGQALPAAARLSVGRQGSAPSSRSARKRIRRLIRWRSGRRRFLGALLHSAQSVSPEWPVILVWPFVRGSLGWAAAKTRCGVTRVGRLVSAPRRMRQG
jgi:hypothetical protein